eukprot:CAMPEP_0201687974 /NCGR_PEP_ID=MMETSP0578-20130828/1784_1 /ASSEMBLY_ACC=CAM_ASM_000663 /TAXON_ID=267565 /ORGANISM="Skeletonema grethea, Strain CCMP 1804" /LENGTH=490 /DNA_ID=CAMNT_0048172159 /DNA_START=56 /DNA_END=1528 /DNA_ORIENTATION=+
MRVLCLHPCTSSATQLHSSLCTLEERLWTKHGIELVFVDAPLLDVNIRVGDSVGVPDGGLTALHLEDGGGEEVVNNSRRWYVEEQVVGNGRSAVLPPSVDDSVGTVTNHEELQPHINDNNHKSTTVNYSGLDASLLHLSQIWSRGGANNNNNNAENSGGGIEQCLPFQGILGIQQGANVAAMLPLLNSANVVYEDEEEEGAKESLKGIFQGLQFVILVDGTDIISQEEQHEEDEEGKDEINKENDNHTGHEEEEEEDWYVGPNGISSLHVIAETTTKDGNAAAAATNKKNSELLAKRYGPNATIQYYKPAKTKASSSQSNTNNNNSQQYNHNQLTSPSLHNILGKYLVHQKNTFHSNPQKRKLLQLQHQLCHVEQLASVMITEEVRRNPPKCLMAMIGPAAASSSEGDSCENMNGQDDENVENSRNEESTTNTTVKAVVGKTVGAWQGPGRVPGEQGGGAPCPETFLLRQEERRNNGLVAPHDVIVADET